ncbi:glycoside hydrolase family 18 protein [Metabacillus litoralis]|uniref:glycoside hydrolase family 18 protein n=1 Tax=Metabacillus litoralis TaxID=152268 RepID=UPI001CFE8667|nr:glycoside hydrolase family 18 protein [Metabacillus litoralis]
MKNKHLTFSISILIFVVGVFSGIFYSSFTNESEIESNPSNRIMTKEEPVKGGTKLIGYVQDFRDPTGLNIKELTHIIFSFAHPTSNGELLMNGEAAYTNLQTITKKAHKQNTKVFLAVGGWYHIEGGTSYDYFKEAISKDHSKSKLINELMKITQKHNLDGIDIDFEHPRSSEDAAHLLSFIKDLSNQLHGEDKELSIAVYSKVNSVTGEEVKSIVYDSEMFKFVDHVNIMAYDGHWDDEYDAAFLSPFSFTHDIVSYWTNMFDELGISRNKLVLGVPFYAQPEEETETQLAYNEIIAHDVTNSDQDRAIINEMIYHYNGTKTIKRKTKLAIVNGLGGMMIWEIGHDAPGDQSLMNVIAEIYDSEYKDIVDQ